ncbi:MAG: glycosyltransferase, partial [Rhodobacterales bacterium]|nr:glycosyltransferase [Paracoccaceae bacterium]MDX5413346.1 glycosyltransferase [Rhodobacterales bacterium]
MALPSDRRVTAIRAGLLAGSILIGCGGFLLFLRYGAADGLDLMDLLRAGLILVSTFWLAWGAMQAFAGLTTRRPAVPCHDGPITSRCVILVPVYNEDPSGTFPRIAAMEASLRRTGLSQHFHIAILSDTRDPAVAEAEETGFLRLLNMTGAEGRIFYRRRDTNRGRKAGNIEDFITRSGAAYDLAVILDADSLMEGATMIEMVRRMEADPRLGLLQTLPQIINARSRFGRIQQFAAAFYSPIFCRGLAMMQGRTGPFWGHNAIVRVRAFAERCGLPDLSGQPPCGCHILSHDYVEAARLARAG